MFPYIRHTFHQACSGVSHVFMLVDQAHILQYMQLVLRICIYDGAEETMEMSRHIQMGSLSYQVHTTTDLSSLTVLEQLHSAHINHQAMRVLRNARQKLQVRKKILFKHALICWHNAQSISASKSNHHRASVAPDLEAVPEISSIYNLVLSIRRK